jgi:HEAT repeat protein
VVEAAAASPHETVRIAAAAGLRNLAPAQAAPTVERLLDDQDAGVRKLALRAVTDLGMSSLEPKVESMAANDPEEALRQLADQGLRRFSSIREAGPEEAPRAGT